jgi:hypothetical protein
MKIKKKWVRPRSIYVTANSFAGENQWHAERMRACRRQLPSPRRPRVGESGNAVDWGQFSPDGGGDGVPYDPKDPDDGGDGVRLAATVDGGEAGGERGNGNRKWVNSPSLLASWGFFCCGDFSGVIARPDAAEATSTGTAAEGSGSAFGCTLVLGGGFSPRPAPVVERMDRTDGEAFVTEYVHDISSTSRSSSDDETARGDSVQDGFDDTALASKYDGEYGSSPSIAVCIMDDVRDIAVMLSLKYGDR